MCVLCVIVACQRHPRFDCTRYCCDLPVGTKLPFILEIPKTNESKVKRTTKVKCPRHGFGFIAYIIPCIYVLYVYECVLSLVSFSPDHFNPCVGGHCFCSSLPHSLSCSPALSLSLFRSSVVFYLLYFSLRPCVLRFVSLSLCVFLSACSYLFHCMSLSRSLARSFLLSLAMPL